MITSKYVQKFPDISINQSFCIFTAFNSIRISKIKALEVKQTVRTVMEFSKLP